MIVMLPTLQRLISTRLARAVSESVSQGLRRESDRVEDEVEKAELGIIEKHPERGGDHRRDEGRQIRIWS
jgi:hypothetical protein